MSPEMNSRSQSPTSRCKFPGNRRQGNRGSNPARELESGHRNEPVSRRDFDAGFSIHSTRNSSRNPCQVGLAWNALNSGCRRRSGLPQSGPSQESSGPVSLTVSDHAIQSMRVETTQGNSHKAPHHERPIMSVMLSSA